MEVEVGGIDYYALSQGWEISVDHTGEGVGVTKRGGAFGFEPSTVIVRFGDESIEAMIVSMEMKPQMLEPNNFDLPVLFRGNALYKMWLRLPEALPFKDSK